VVSQTALFAANLGHLQCSLQHLDYAGCRFSPTLPKDIAFVVLITYKGLRSSLQVSLEVELDPKSTTVLKPTLDPLGGPLSDYYQVMFQMSCRGCEEMY
jgi:hypothetical protein